MSIYLCHAGALAVRERIGVYIQGHGGVAVAEDGAYRFDVEAAVC
nr:hypothetical protein [Collinsella sp. An271]